ncbi:MAG: hypothetical protein V1740_05435 [Candidatus Woesearchaeota archaeon]
MSENEFAQFLKKNKQQVSNAVKMFEFHSKEFDKKIRKIISIL